MKYRQLGNTGIMVSEIGFGGWGIGGATEGATSYGSTDDRESIRALEKALERGVNFFDTAGVYGHSEALIGSTFKNRRDKVVIATKVGFIEHTGPQDFSTKNLIASLEKSLKNLQTDYMDLYQLHNPKIDQVNLIDISGTLNILKSRGLIRAYGVSVKSPEDGLTVLRQIGFSSLQVNLSMIDQRAVDNGLLKQAKEQGVGIIGRTPLNFGFLTDNGKTMDLNFGPQDHRSVWPMGQRESWQKAARLLSKVHPVYPLAHLALRYCLSVDGVSTVIPGMLTVNDVLENTFSPNWNWPPLTPETMVQIRQVYDDNDQFFIKPS